ncbi:MAG: NifU N-terminal domain-containing protein [Acidimicrobiia bacterium]
MATVRPSTTPNPNAMKFTLDVTLPTRIDTTRGEGTETAFAQAVLAFEGVASVFGVNDFVTVTREPDADWDPIVCAVEDAAAELLDESSGAPAGDDVAEARKLLRNAVAPPKPRPVEIGRPPERDQS